MSAVPPLLALPRMGLGCMTMSWPGRDDTESVRTVQAALDGGLTMLDTADRYGQGHNERLLAQALRDRRTEVVLATKVGFVGRAGQGRPVDGRPEHLHAAARASLQRLEVEAVDLLYLHRVDPEVPVEESVGAMAELVSAGLVRHLGLSEVSAATLRRAAAVHPIAAVQSEYSLWSREPESEVLGACAELGTSFVAYGPLGKGFLAGAFRSATDVPPDGRLREQPRLQGDNLARNVLLLEALEALAAGLGCSPAQLALAWVMARGAVPLPGISRRRHLADDLGALAVELGAADVAALERAFPPGAASGDRKSPSALGLTAG